MTKYDKIYIPCDENDSALFAAWGEEATDYVGAIQEKENVIVATLEDLQNMWLAAEFRANWIRTTGGPYPALNSSIYPDLKTYLGLKGIKY